ncbi:MAG: peptidoglycan DD-metalloendopeptidase family protein [Gammaproteobacteria bacterium]|nr:peptidoglycan DD-metalloendopeptidase family protein [Gammaproteobacteria bacterium]
MTVLCEKKPLITAFLALLIFSITGCGSLVHYKVQEGDTLYSIGWHYGQDAKKIAEWNKLRTPYVIHQGQILRIAPPAGVPGEPLFTLSQPEKASVQHSTRLALSSPVSKYPVNQNRGPIVWHWPAEGKLISTFSSRKIDRKGINISAMKGSAIRAAALGKVVYSGSGLASYGNLLIIKHNESYLSAYAHNDQLLVKEGDLVSKGQRVATMGATGSNKVMLHFEIRYKGNPVDPLRYLPKR